MEEEEIIEDIRFNSEEIERAIIEILELHLIGKNYDQK